MRKDVSPKAVKQFRNAVLSIDSVHQEMLEKEFDTFFGKRYPELRWKSKKKGSGTRVRH
ncbi:MAG: hypothetical protein ACYCSO_05090 [Cuniculiplasma sp.]